MIKLIHFLNRIDFDLKLLRKKFPEWAPIFRGFAGDMKSATKIDGILNSKRNRKLKKWIGTEKLSVETSNSNCFI